MILQKRNLTATIQKSIFMLLTVEYLGHEIRFNTIKHFNPNKLEFIKISLRLQNLEWWKSLAQWTSIPIILLNFMLLWSLYIFSSMILNFTGDFNWKHCLKILYYPLQNMFFWHYPKPKNRSLSLKFLLYLVKILSFSKWRTRENWILFHTLLAFLPLIKKYPVSDYVKYSESYFH